MGSTHAVRDGLGSVRNAGCRTGGHHRCNGEAQVVDQILADERSVQRRTTFAEHTGEPASGELGEHSRPVDHAITEGENVHLVGHGVERGGICCGDQELAAKGVRNVESKADDGDGGDGCETVTSAEVCIDLIGADWFVAFCSCRPRTHNDDVCERPQQGEYLLVDLAAQRAGLAAGVVGGSVERGHEVGAHPGAVAVGVGIQPLKLGLVGNHGCIVWPWSGILADMARTLDEQLAVSGPINLADFDSRATTGFDGDKDDSRKGMAELGEELGEHQERLYASAESGNAKVLVLLQGMDTSGKGGIIRHVAGLVDPQGLAITSFKKPTREELKHDFLWRIEKGLPQPGKIGVFDRSQYEDVLIVRVRQLAEPAEIERRYDAINEFEKKFTDSGGVLIKCFLHISADDQKGRLAARLEDPSKYWKYNQGDIDERMLWDDYQHAYAIALERCSTQWAPWHLIPSGRKWYRNWAVAALLAEKLRELNLDWPKAAFDVEAEKARLAST